MKIKAPKFVDIIIRLFIVVSILFLIPFGVTYISSGFNVNEMNFFGYNLYRSYGDSMKPTLDGELLISKRVTSEDIGVGDVIAFYKDDGMDGVVGVVHRVIEERDGGFVTMGDNNDFHDGWIILPEDIRGKVLYKWNGLKLSPVENKELEFDFNLDFSFCDDKFNYPFELMNVKVTETHCPTKLRGE